AEEHVAVDEHVLGRIGREVGRVRGEGELRLRSEHVEVRIARTRRELELGLGRVVVIGRFGFTHSGANIVWPKLLSAGWRPRPSACWNCQDWTRRFSTASVRWAISPAPPPMRWMNAASTAWCPARPCGRLTRRPAWWDGRSLCSINVAKRAR